MATFRVLGAFCAIGGGEGAGKVLRLFRVGLVVPLMVCFYGLGPGKGGGVGFLGF